MSLRCVERSMTDATTKSAELPRVLPFAVFIVLTFFQDSAGETGRYWIYLLKTIAAGASFFYVHGVPNCQGGARQAGIRV